MGKDFHSSLRTEGLGSTEGGGFHLALARLRWSKDNVACSLHASPSTFSSAGVQRTDMLNYLAFQRTACPFHHGDAYCAWTSEGLDLPFPGCRPGPVV